MDIITIMEFLWLMGWLVVPIFVGIFYGLTSKRAKPELEDSEAESIEEEPKEKDVYVDAYKKHAHKFVKEPYVKKDGDIQMNKDNREPFYLLIILVLLIIMFAQYTKYREDSFSRITQCFADVVPDSEQDFCESFYEKNTDPKITLSEAENVMSNCWYERTQYCKEEALGDECTFGSYNYCQVKYPDHWEILKDKEEQ